MVRGVESHPSKLSQLQLKRNRPPGPAATSPPQFLQIIIIRSQSCHCRNNVTASRGQAALIGAQMRPEEIGKPPKESRKTFIKES